MPEQPEPNVDHEAIAQRRVDKLLGDAIEALEHEFDTVLILTTRITESGSTTMESRSSGNWYAQIGMMSHMLNKRRTMTDEQVRQDMRAEE